MKKRWVYTYMVFTIIFSILLSIFVCFVIYANDRTPYVYFFNLENVTDILGTVISCISIVITGFFAVLAVDAYGRIRDIKREAVEAKEYRDAAYSSLRDIGNANVSFYENVIKLIGNAERFINKDDQESRMRHLKWRNDCHRELYRLGLKPFLLDEEKRIQLINNLGTFAEEVDLEKLKEISTSRTESEELRNTATNVLNSISNSSSFDDANTNISFCYRVKKAWKVLCNK